MPIRKSRFGRMFRIMATGDSVEALLLWLHQTMSYAKNWIRWKYFVLCLKWIRCSCDSTRLNVVIRDVSTNCRRETMELDGVRCGINMVTCDFVLWILGLLVVSFRILRKPALLDAFFLFEQFQNGPKAWECYHTEQSWTYGAGRHKWACNAGQS